MVEVIFSLLAILSFTVSCEKELVGEQSAPQEIPEVEVIEFEDKKAKMAFLNCTQLKSIKLPADLTIIGDAAFKYCIVLKEFRGKFASEDNIQ